MRLLGIWTLACQVPTGGLYCHTLDDIPVLISPIFLARTWVCASNSPVFEYNTVKVVSSPFLDGRINVPSKLVEHSNVILSSVALPLAMRF